MKNNIKSIVVGLILLTTFSCDKEDEVVSEVVPVIYPEIILSGDPVIAIGVGDTYVEAGAISIDASTDPPTETVLTPISNDVDPSQVGFYSVKYTSKSSNGFITNATRLVLVTDFDPSVDLSGTYARSSNGQTVTVTKKGTGLYTTDNVGGVAGAPEYIFDVYFAQLDESTIVVPSQPNPLGGDVFCDETELLITADDTSFSWVVNGSGFGTALRTFSHQ